MNVKKLILILILKIVNIGVCLFPINKNKITIVSLQGKELSGDLKIIRGMLPSTYEVVEVLYHFKKNDIIHSIGYMFNSIKQIWNINRSKLVLINDNNFVISKFKRPGVTVIQVWHANGAIKKFGNCTKRSYTIGNYDYVLANSAYWKEPYARAFGLSKDRVVVTGLPKVDCLLNKDRNSLYKKKFYNSYPQFENKKIILYAPTFRGNISKGIRSPDFGVGAIADELDDEYIVVCKFHPLVNKLNSNGYEGCVNLSEVDLYELLVVSHALISDFSSIIFDYSLLNKPIALFAPDKNNYNVERGCIIDYNEVPGTVCDSVKKVIEVIEKKESVYDVDKFFTHIDGGNIVRVLKLIEDIIGKED